MIHPLAILAIGIVTVIGLILFCRLNAFIALITAAIVVSVLSGGPLEEAVAEAADSFGRTAGSIGIVIALAAIIGKCLMDSGGADRVVRACLRVTGEKRASAALMGSGFILSVPVFFDTVFYLLIPLARSLYRQTRHNYIMYILAIGGGATITHTLVPPTPGPLAMADNLGVDVGMMIMMGAMIALPTALVCLIVARLADRILDLPMRPYAGEAEDQPPPADEELPPLLLALLPVILPVILISANTIVTVLNEREHRSLLVEGRAVSMETVTQRLVQSARPEPLDPEAGDAIVVAAPTAALLRRLPADLVERLQAKAGAEQTVSDELVSDVEANIAELIANNRLLEVPGFQSLSLSREGERLRRIPAGERTEAQNRLLQWMYLDAAFPGARVETTMTRLNGITGFFGNANLALLLSAAIAMGTLVWKRRLTFQELGKTVETALMSGGVIILITAAGGAFGGTLRASGLQDYFGSLLGSGGQVQPGLSLLVAGFGVASLIKIAQGSGTVAMLTTSAIFAGLFPTMDALVANLGCDPVYLALAIGSGSLVGCWMNDSGFWVVARMSVLSETETLKAWTISVAVLGVAAFAFTMLAAWLLPLV